MGLERIDMKLRDEYKKEYPDRNILYSKTLNHFEEHYVDWLERKLSASQNASTSESALPISDVVVSAIDEMSDTDLKEQERLLNGEIAALEGRLASVENERFYRKHPECRQH